MEAGSEDFVKIRHPQPMSAQHVIILPRRRVPDIEALLQDEAGWTVFAAFAEAQVDFQQTSMCCNYGCRQEVKQVHFHVLPRESLPEKQGDMRCLEADGRRSFFGGSGNIYMDSADLADREFVRKIFMEGKKEYPKGFSMIWRRERCS